MAEEYDPAGPFTFDTGAEANEAYEQEDYVQNEDAADEDDDYDPTAGFNYDEENDEQSKPTSSEQTPQHAPAPAQSGQPSKPQQTIAGFVLEESDDEQEQDESAQTPSQLGGDTGALAASQTPDVSLHSAPQDTATPSTSLNGSATVPVPASTSSVLDSSILQASAPDSGKIDVSPVASAVPTPQPEANSVATAPPPVPQANGSLVAVPPARLPHDKVGQLEDRIKDDPKGDTDAWLSLIKHYYDKGQYEGARDVYKRFFEVFPTAVSMWVRYVQMENELDERDNVVVILNESVMAVPSVDLWKLYLDHVRRALPLINDADGKNRSEITKAFEVTLDNVGVDPDAGMLWRDYIDFLLSGPGTVGGQSWQDLQKVDTLRKAYQRSIKLPHFESMRLWKEYETFEMGLHKATGRKHVQEQSPHYMQARTARMQLEQKLEGLDRKSLPKLPPVYGCAGDDEFGTQVEKWRAWVEWERDEDPLVYRGTEDDAYRKRVLYAYKQATLCLCFYPDIWFEAVNWCFAQGIDAITSEGEQLLDKAIANNPESVLLAMLKADRVEAALETGNTDEILCRNGEKLDVPYERVHTALYALRTKLKEKDDKALAQITAHYASLPQEDEQMNNQDDDDDNNNNLSTKPKTREEQKKTDIEAVKVASATHMDILKRTISYIWVAKMRAFRRVQGQGKPLKKGDASAKVVKGFRGIFSDARPRGPLSSDVYIASALMEWRCYKDPSAIKIFERGMKLFPMDEAFILEYVKHLIALSDVTNARVVFESTIPKICNAADFTLEQKREKCRPLITYMHDYESKYGDFAQVHKIEKRMAELYPEEPEISRFSHRFSLPNFDAMHVQLVLSPTQALPKAYQPQPPVALQQVPQPQISIENHTRSPKGPEILLGPNGPYVASPKRPLDDSDTDSPRKFMRGESPLKGAAGVRIQNKQAAAGGGGFATKTFVPNSAPAPLGPPQLPPAIDSMLRRLPGSNNYFQYRFDPAKLTMLLPTINVETAYAQFTATGNVQRQF